MNKLITGQGPDALAICEALGVDPKTCASIEFRMAAREVVTVTVERHVYDHEAKQLAEVLSRYNLVPAEEQSTDDDGVSESVRLMVEARARDKAFY